MATAHVKVGDRGKPELNAATGIKQIAEILEQVIQSSPVITHLRKRNDS